jgi:hypothetical protein
MPANSRWDLIQGLKGYKYLSIKLYIYALNKQKLYSLQAYTSPNIG